MKVGTTIWVLDELRGVEVEVETEMHYEQDVAGALTVRLMADCHRVQRDNPGARWRRVQEWS